MPYQLCKNRVPNYWPYGCLGVYNPQPFVVVNNPVPDLPYLPSEDLAGNRSFVFPTLPGQPRLPMPTFSDVSRLYTPELLTQQWQQLN